MTLEVWKAALESIGVTVTPVSDGDLLRAVAKLDISKLECDRCARSFYMKVAVETARRLLADGDTTDGGRRLFVLYDHHCKNSKFGRLWTEELAAGRDPRDAFIARGWKY